MLSGIFRAVLVQEEFFTWISIHAELIHNESWCPSMIPLDATVLGSEDTMQKWNHQS